MKIFAIYRTKALEWCVKYISPYVVSNSGFNIIEKNPDFRLSWWAIVTLSMLLLLNIYRDLSLLQTSIEIAKDNKKIYWSLLTLLKERDRFYIYNSQIKATIE